MSDSPRPDPLLYWLEIVDDYMMLCGLVVAILGALLAFWVLLRPIVLGTPFL